MILRVIRLSEYFAFTKVIQELKEEDFINNKLEEELQKEKESFVNP